MSESILRGVDTDTVVVAILNNLQDFAILEKHRWYRIPTTSADKWLRDHWPPQWLAFYHTKVFGSLAYGVHYFARVVDIRTVYRQQLFPDEPAGPRSGRRYYQLFVEPLRELPQPILSRQLRRIVFIPTTWQKFIDAVEINDLYDGSPLEDRLWVEFKRLGIEAQRQEFVRTEDEDHALDFAIYCVSGKLDVETDGDRWHANPERSASDNLRNNALKTAGWDILRFTTQQIQEQIADYTVPTVLANINRLDGIDEGRPLARRFDQDSSDNLRQSSLFDVLD